MDVHTDWDVVVVGAGPAGSAAAMSALRTDPSARVLLLDRHDFPRDKSCGDALAPQALDELARLGAADVLADRVPVHHLRLESPGGRSTGGRLARPDYVVPRTLLDARLVAAAVRTGAVLARRTVRRLAVHPDHVVLDDELSTRVVVGADGANGVVRRQIGVPRQPAQHTAVAVRGYATAPPGPPEQLVRMASRDWPAYAWSFAAGDGTANVGFGMLLPALRASRRGGRAELHGRLAEMLPAADPRRLTSAHLPLSSWRPRQPAGRVLLAGDAMSLINPLTGEGIFYALLSGRLAGAAAAGATAAGAGRPGADGAGRDPGSAYREAIERELGRHLRHTTWVSRLTRGPRLLDAAVAAAGTSRSTFDALTELGLGRGLVTASMAARLARQLTSGRAA